VSIAWLTAALALAAALTTTIGIACRWAWRLLSRTRDFLDDWSGQPGRPGVSGRPGVMARLQTVEQMVTEIRGETQPDHGHSLRDVVHKIREDLSDVKADQAAMRARQEQLEYQREHREEGKSGG
jgi:hypothetical protein